MHKAIKLLIVLFSATFIASAGGVFEFKDSAAHFNSVGDSALTSEFIYRYFVAGVLPEAEANIEFKSQMGDSIPTITDYKSELSTEMAYYSRFSSQVSQELAISGQEPKMRSISANSYIIMPKKFDSTHSFNVLFVDENDPKAQMKTTFTYDNVKYEFITESDSLENPTFDLFLQPYSPQLEGLNLNYEDNFHESDFLNGLEYEGNLNTKAIKFEA